MQIGGSALDIRRWSTLFAMLLFVVGSIIPCDARAGLYEIFAPFSGVKSSPGVLFRFQYFDPEVTIGQENSPPRPLQGLKTSFLDGLIQPVLSVRTLATWTHVDRATITTADGKTLTVSSDKMDPSQFGHRTGFILDSAEIGLKGRHQMSGVYYQLKAELIPREKDGNRSSDYLKDAYVGWNLFPWMDLRVGRMKVPISQANMKSSDKSLLIQSPTLDTLITKRQIGAYVTVGDPWQVFTLTGGVFNSSGLAVEQIRRSTQLQYAARAELRLHRLLNAVKVKALDFEATLGGSFSWVKENFDPPTEHRWMGADLHLHAWLFTIEGEFVVKDFYTESPGAAGRKADRGWGWHADLQIQAWPGLLDLACRIESMDGDSVIRGAGATQSIDELAKQKKMWVTAGISLKVTNEARVDVNYVHRIEKEGISFNNDMAVVLFQYAL